MRERLMVRRSGESRLTVTETDPQGGRVVSTTIKAHGAMVTRRVNADGSTELHVFKGVRPTLGTQLDNVLGQTVEAVSDARPLKVVGQGARVGVDADELQLGAGHYVWVSRDSGLPVEEQVVSDGKVVHDLTFSNVVADAAAPDGSFDAASLGGADQTVTEDLGFRQVASAGAATSAIGFVPLSVPSPAGFAADVQGYIDPAVRSGDAPAEAAFVSSFSNGTGGVLVTQVRRPGIGNAVPDATDEGPDPAHAVTVAGHPAVAYNDGTRCQILFARRDVLVTIEGALPEATMVAYAEQIH
jgi:hypothetical protein